jgi:hypothetical protein
MDAVGSDIRHRASLRTGDNITIRCATLDQWEKKGHQILRVYVGYWLGETLTTDMVHTAIFSIASVWRCRLAENRSAQKKRGDSRTVFAAREPPRTVDRINQGRRRKT